MNALPVSHITTVYIRESIAQNTPQECTTSKWECNEDECSCSAKDPPVKEPTVAPARVVLTTHLE
jgi:hypothetical protein